MRSHHTTSLLATLLLLGICDAEERHAEGEGATPAKHEAHEKHYRFHAGALFTSLATFVDGNVYPTVGGGLFFGWEAVPERLDLEATARAFSTEGGVSFAEEVTLTFPFSVKPWFEPYLSFGPTVAEYLVGGEAAGAPGRSGWGIGGTAIAGASFYVHPRVAIVVEIDYNLLYRWLSAEGQTKGALVNELGGSAGALFTF